MRIQTLTLIAASLIGTTFAADDNVVAGDIFAAINLRDMKAVTSMLKTDKEKVLSARTTGGITPLHYAASLDNTEAVYRLLEAGVNVDIKTEDSLTTPLHWAADTGASDTLRLLIKKGADVHAKAKNGYTPFHFLARGSANPEIAKYLQSAGADLNALDLKSNTPLHIAASRGNAPAVSYFLKAGAKADTKNSAGKLAIELAKDDTTKAAFGVPVTKPVTAPVTEVPKAKPTQAVMDPPKPAPEEARNVATQVSETPEVLVENSYTNVNTTSELQVGEEYRRFLNDPDTIDNLDGSAYKGEIFNGLYHGFGVLCKQNRERYQGEWKKGMRHGVGTFTYANGDNFAGSWKNNVPHGKGIYVYSNGGKVNGTWKNGVLVQGEGQYVTTDGSRYYGYWEDNKLINSSPISGATPQ